MLGLAGVFVVTTPVAWGAWGGMEWIAVLPSWVVGMSLVAWFILAEAAALLAVVAGLDAAGRAIMYNSTRSRRERRSRALRKGVCPRCGYDVRGLPRRRCPECGEALVDDRCTAAARCE